LVGTVNAVGPASAIWLGVPLLVEGMAIGAMVVQSYHDPQAYGETEQRMLEFVSSQVAMVIHRKRMDDALRVSEESFRGVFENATVGLSRTTIDGRILLANNAMLRMLGFDSFGDLKARNLSQEGFAKAGARQEFLARMERENEVHGLESIWLKADGSEIYIRESSRAVRDEEGNIQYFESVVEDISDRRRAEVAVQEKIAALQSLAEIDREILAAEDVKGVLDLVCTSIADLIHVPKSAIVALEQGTTKYVTATHGFSTEFLDEQFDSAVRDGMLSRWDAHIIIDNSGLPANYMPWLRKSENIRALIIEPFRLASGSLGALAVFDTVVRQWTDDDIQLVRLLAGQSALALEKIHLLTDARQRADEFSNLHQVAMEIMNRRELSTVLKLIVQKAAAIYQVSNAFIYLYDDQRQEVVLSVVSSSDLMLGTTMKLGEGMAGRVAATLKPLTVQNYSTWDQRAPVYENRKVLAVLEVPMLYGGSLIGILGIESLISSRTFDERDLRSLSLLAEQAASAIYNARLFSAIEDRNRELNRLSHASSTLLAGVSSDIPHLCRAIADLLASEFHNSHCSIWLVNEDDLTLERKGVAGPFVDMIRPALLTTKGPGLIAKAIRTHTSIRVGDVREFQDYVEGWEKALSELVVPLRAGDRVVGAIDLQNQYVNAYSDDDIRLIELIASQAALMVEHVHLYLQTDHRLHQLTVLSNIDSAIASSLDLQVTLNILVSQISMHLETDAVDVMLLNPHLRMLEYAAGRGFRGSAIRHVSLLLGEDQAGLAALERTVVSIFDLAAIQGTLRHPERIAGEDFVSMSAVPLVAKGQVKGVLELYYRRPVEPDADWINFLEILARQAAVAVEDASLFNDMQRSFTELAVGYDAAIEGWARVLQMRHREPEELSQTLATLTLETARRLGITEAEMAHVYRGVLLHDIGKLSIPDTILFKPGPLTSEEWDMVRYHPAYAYDFLQSIAYLRPAINIPYCQHERWDGSGYPRGLTGRDIPLEARVFSVVNVWTVLQYERPYRQPWNRERATAYVLEQAGREFDPAVVEAFRQLLLEKEQ
jgi:PAS domain S-box-containing protein